jgi:MFS transporter, SET family, sugar efflux transporter
MLIFWTFVFASGIDVMAIYLSAGVASLALSILVYIRWPRDGSTPWQDRPSGLNMAGALAEIAHPRVLLRLLLLGAVASAGVLYMVLISLIFEASPHRTTSDVALYVGMVAGWEVPFMLILTRVGVRLRRSTLISVGAVVYCGHLALLPVLVGTPLVWLLPLLAGIGGTAIITLPIAYYQDLMHGRPGTAGAMLALQKLVADVLAAAAFVVGTHFGGYGLTALLGAAISIGGALGLAIADRNA